ncbi:unnamed protein product [Lymnaea stagnalis]|uniref:Uncharacterized protein n=1 Tax=Lymnaea stagnalis TaxID=6523 RepID=A0AAV2HAK2_LYMST
MKISVVIACVFLCFVDVQMSKQANKYPDFECYGKRITEIIEKSENKLKLVCDEDDPTELEECEEQWTGMEIWSTITFKCPDGLFLSGMRLPYYKEHKDLVVKPLCCKIKNEVVRRCRYLEKTAKKSRIIPTGRVMNGFQTEYNHKTKKRSWKWSTCARDKK